ncbi:hypothetical protein KEM52_003784 [Ascosphaera acerosa]|nr:hypothetical protein KEM52_003784 [Ascosphaera acerosa]
MHTSQMFDSGLVNACMSGSSAPEPFLFAFQQQQSQPQQQAPEPVVSPSTVSEAAVQAAADDDAGEELVGIGLYEDPAMLAKERETSLASVTPATLYYGVPHGLPSQPEPPLLKLEEGFDLCQAVGQRKRQATKSGSSSSSSSSSSSNGGSTKPKNPENKAPVSPVSGLVSPHAITRTNAAINNGPEFRNPFAGLQGPQGPQELVGPGCRSDAGNARPRGVECAQHQHRQLMRPAQASITHALSRPPPATNEAAYMGSMPRCFV